MVENPKVVWETGNFITSALTEFIHYGTNVIEIRPKADIIS